MMASALATAVGTAFLQPLLQVDLHTSGPRSWSVTDERNDMRFMTGHVLVEASELRVTIVESSAYVITPL